MIDFIGRKIRGWCVIKRSTPFLLASLTTLGVGIYNVTAITNGNTNYTGNNETWWIRVSKSDTTTTLYLNDAETNLTITYGDALNVTSYTTNLTSTNYINLTTYTNPFNGSLATGLYNITAITDGNTNYTRSYEIWWLNVSKLVTTTTLYLNEARSNLNTTYGDQLNLTAYSTNSSYTSLSLFVNLTNWTNPFIGDLQAGYYNITGITDSNANVTGSYETWYLNISKQNASIALYIDGHRSNVEVNFEDLINSTIYLFNNSVDVLNFNVSFYNNLSGTWVEHMNNASPLYNSTNTTDLTPSKYYLFGGRWDGNTNYSASAENWTVFISSFNLTVAYSTGCNITEFTYACMNFTNNSFTGLQPCNQTSTCSLFNITLNSEGSDRNGTLMVKINQTFKGVPIYLSNSSNYSATAINLSTTYQEIYHNLTIGSSISIWHFMDFINPPPGTLILYNLLFNVVGVNS